MVEIEVINNSKTELIPPVEMLENKYSDCVFQLFDRGKPKQNFFINCGYWEESVIRIWYNDEDGKYRLSTQDKKGLLSYFEWFKVCKVDAKISIKVEL